MRELQMEHDALSVKLHTEDRKEGSRFVLLFFNGS
jgi:hypothetical protein